MIKVDKDYQVKYLAQRTMFLEQQIKKLKLQLLRLDILSKDSNLEHRKQAYKEMAALCQSAINNPFNRERK